MALKCISLLFMLVAAFGFIDAIPEDYVYISKTNSYYKYHTTEVNWPDAKVACEREGGFLFYPETERELEEVISLFSITSDYISVGISESETKGVYKTVQGRPITQVTYYSKWRSGDPSSSDSYTGYVYLNIAPRKLGVYSGGREPFVCKFRQTMDTVVATSAEELKMVIANSSERVVQAIQTQAKLISDGIANQATAAARRMEMIQRQDQAAYRQLDTLLKLSTNQTVLLETLAKQSLVLDQLAESVGLLLQVTKNQTTIMERQAQALEKIQDDDNKLYARSEQ